MKSTQNNALSDRESNQERKFSNVIFWTVAIVLFLPIIILPPNFQPSDWTRAILFKMILTGLVAFLFYRFFYQKDWAFSVPKWNLQTYLPFLALVGLWLVFVITTIFSVDLRFSFFGSPSRAGGLLNISFFFLFATLIAVLVRGQTWEKLMKVNLIAGLLASLLALIQYFGLFKNVFLGFETGATPSFLGNSTFLAIYMIFLVFSSFDFFLFATTKKEKITYGLLCLLFLFTILISGSRATYIGIFVAFAFYFLFYPKKLAEYQHNLIPWINSKRLKIFKIASSTIVGLLALLLIYVNITPTLPGFIENNTQLSYFVHNRLSFDLLWQDLTGTRFSAWKITLQAIKEKPAVGWGPENFHIGFEKYFDPTLPPSLQRLWWDRPHNVFLEYLVNSGIFGLIGYAGFWIILFWQLQVAKRLPKAKDQQTEGLTKKSYIAHGLQAMFIAYLTVLFFNFDSFSTYTISFFFIGYALYLIFLNSKLTVISFIGKKLFAKNVIAVVGLLAIVLFFWFWNLKPLYYGEKIVSVKNLTDSRRCQKALDTAKKQDWTKSGIVRPTAILRYADTIKDCTFAQPEKEVEFAKKGISLLKVAAEIQPGFSRTWLFMGAFNNVLAAREQNKEIQKTILGESEDYLKKALRLSPKRQEIHIEMTKTYLLKEDYHAMETVADECITVDPTRGECYWYKGIAQIFMGDQVNGKNNIDLSKKYHYNDPPWLQLGIAYIKQKNYRDAIDAYQKLTGIYPNNASYHATLAVLYKEVKNYTKAGEEAARVFELQPDNVETFEFLRILLGLTPNDPNLHISLASMYRKIGKTKEANQELLTVVNIYNYWLSQNPHNGLLHLSLSTIYKELGDIERAIDEAVTAFNVDHRLAKDVISALNLIGTPRASENSIMIDLYLQSQR